MIFFGVYIKKKLGVCHSVFFQMFRYSAFKGYFMPFGGPNLKTSLSRGLWVGS